jgi:hypothetical protein
MAHGRTRRASKEVVEYVRWFRQRHGGGAAAELDLELAVAATILNAMRAASRTSLCTFFNRYVTTPYAARIYERDESFFAGPPSDAVPPGFNGVADAIRRLWTTLAHAERDEVWARLEPVVRECAAWEAERAAGVDDASRD